MYQTNERPASDLRFCFKPSHPKFTSLLKGCTDEELRHEFSDIATGNIKAGQYQSSARLIEGTCGSIPFINRCGTDFNLEQHLDAAGILLVEGGVEADILGAIQNVVISHIRRRGFASPRLVLVLDEANNVNLCTEREARAMAECQKMGLDIHVLVQLLDFPSAAVTNGVLSNCVRHEWFWNANPAVISKAVEDLGFAVKRVRTPVNSSAS